MLAFIEDSAEEGRARGAGVRAPGRAAAFAASSRRPIYRHDIVEQFDAIGVRSLTVVLLTGFFTGAVLALQSGLTLDQFGARPVVGRLVSASMIKELGPVLTGADADRPRRVGHRRRARLDGRDRPDQRAARARHRSDPQAGRAAGAGRHLHGAGADRRSPTSSASSAAGSWRGSSCRWRPASTGRRCSRRSTCRTCGWGSSSRSSSGFVIVTIACHVGLRTSGRHAGRRPGDDRRRRGRIGGGDRGGLLRDAHADFADVLRHLTHESEPERVGASGRAGPRSRPGAPVVMFDHVSLAFDEKVVLQGRQLHAAHGPHEDHPGRERRGKSTILKIILGLLAPTRASSG